MGEEFGMGAEDRFSMLSGIAHDPIQRDVFTPIFFGATIHIPDASDIGNPGALAEWVKATGVTIVHLTPAMGQLLTANATAEMPSLKVALFVGDVLTKRDIKRLQRLAPNVVAVNMYGTTETQRAVSFLKVPNDNSIETLKEILPSGKGMKDVQLLVLTDSGLVAGHGELGEIYVRSPHMSAGYLDLPDATAAKFLLNPFTKKEGDRMYKSGDLGRFLHDGSVECVGRADDQIKIRGFRIELSEIDTHLGQHEHVRENKTLVMRNAHEEKVGAAIGCIDTRNVPCPPCLHASSILTLRVCVDRSLSRTLWRRHPTFRSTRSGNI
jgi:L-aminoadipate-semialdehyde dehydrogenase